MKCRYHTKYETPVSVGGWCTKFGVVCDSPFEESEAHDCARAYEAAREETWS